MKEPESGLTENILAFVSNRAEAPGSYSFDVPYCQEDDGEESQGTEDACGGNCGLIGIRPTGGFWF